MYSIGLGVRVGVALAVFEAVAMAAVVEPLSSPSVPRSGGCRRGRGGSSGTVFLLSCFSCLPWWCGGKLREVGVRLLVVVLVVVFLDVAAPAGRGGEGSARREVAWCCWWLARAEPSRRVARWCGVVGAAAVRVHRLRFRRMRRTALAAIYKAWRFFFPDGERYGDSGVA